MHHNKGEQMCWLVSVCNQIVTPNVVSNHKLVSTARGGLWKTKSRGQYRLIMYDVGDPATRKKLNQGK